MNIKNGSINIRHGFNMNTGGTVHTNEELDRVRKMLDEV